MPWQQQECACAAQVDKVVERQYYLFPRSGGPVQESIVKSGQGGYDTHTENQGPGDDPHTQGVEVGKVKFRGIQGNAEEEKRPREDGQESPGEEDWKALEDVEVRG